MHAGNPAPPSSCVYRCALIWSIANLRIPVYVRSNKKAIAIADAAACYCVCVVLVLSEKMDSIIGGGCWKEAKDETDGGRVRLILKTSKRSIDPAVL